MSLNSKSILRALEQSETPILPIAAQIGYPGCQVHLVNETVGLGGSHKDRPVAVMLASNLAANDSNATSEVVDYTTGSAGCSIAAIAKAIGIKATLFIPDNTTPERITFMRAHGAQVYVTPPDQALHDTSLSRHQIWIAGAVSQAQAYVEATRGAFLLNQSANPKNAAAFHALAANILANFSEKHRPTHVVAAAGTGATIVGLGQVLRPWGVHTVAVEPSKSPSTWATKHQATFKHHPHMLLGTGAGAASPIICKGIKEVDEIIQVDDEEAYAVCRELQQKGLDFGATTGANIIAVRRILSKNSQARVVAIAHDGGWRYRSRGL